MAPTRIPGIPYAAMPKAGTKASGLAWPPRLIVIHATDNTAPREAEASYAATRMDAQSGWTSAHAYVDVNGPLGSLPLTLQAWAAYGYANSHGIHIEMCGRSGAVPAATIAHTAALVRTLLQLGAAARVKLSPADVAAGRSGICGHRDITLGLHVGDHEDPGASFDWAGFMAQVNGQGDSSMGDLDAQLPAPWTENGHNALAVVMEIRKGLWVDDASTGYGQPAPTSVIGKLYTQNVYLRSKLDALTAGQVSQDAVNAAVKAALADPAVVAPLVDAVADALARRLAQ